MSSVSLQWTFGHVWTAGSSRAAAAVGQRLPLSALAGARCSGHLWRTGGSPGKVLKLYFTSSLFKQFSFVCILWQQEQTDNLCLDFLLLHFRTRQKMSELCRYLVGGKKIIQRQTFLYFVEFYFFHSSVRLIIKLFQTQKSERSLVLYLYSHIFILSEKKH